MIHLDVRDYCHTCPDFEAHTTMLYNDDKAESIYVSCAHIRKCERLYEHIKDEQNIDPLNKPTIKRGDR